MSGLPSLYDRILERIARHSPGPIAGAIDLLRPRLGRGFGGAFNGQQRRIEAVREAFERVHFESIIETGTYRGTTTAFLRGISSAPIATIEADSRYYNYSRFRFVGRGVTVMSGDSAQMLERLAAGDPWRRSPAFFYLDAHWLAALPLPREIATITRQWSDYVVVVDDFRVPDDAGYGFDDYGEAGALAVEILAPIATPRTIVYWPNARSDAETGARRGWVMLVSAGSIDERLRSMTAIRRAGELTAVIGTANASRR
jgi:hypothetical protein